MSKIEQPKIIYRDFQISDLDTLALLDADIWIPEANENVRLDAGKVDLANFARKATFTRVAELNGEVVGIVQVKVNNNKNELEDFWNEVQSLSIKRVQDLDPRQAEVLENYFKFEERVHSILLSECKCDTNYELVLFAVSEKTRGLGVGTELLKLAMQHLKNQGAKSFFLFTDTCCNWQYYENRGMVRSAKYISTEAEVKNNCPSELYIYTSAIE